jgi:hypothetical protein
MMLRQRHQLPSISLSAVLIAGKREMTVDILSLYRLAGAAKTDLEGLLSIARLQNYGRVDAHTSEMAFTILMRPDSDETVTQLMKSLDNFVDGVAALKAEIAARRAAVK